VYLYLCLSVSCDVCLSVCLSMCVCKASELVAVKSKADEIISQKAALDDHIATLKVKFNMLCAYSLTFMHSNKSDN